MERRISRRAFAKRLAAGAALLALHPACTSVPRSPAQALRSDLADLSGTLLFDDATRYAAASDFGNIVHRMPAAVLRPGSAQDILKTIQFANRPASRSPCGPRDPTHSSARVRSRAAS